MSTPENPPVRHEPRTEQTQPTSDTNRRTQQGEPPQPLRHEMRDWLMLIVTAALVGVTIWYVRIATQQRNAMIQQSQAMIAQRDVMIQQVNASLRQTEEMKAQTNTLNESLAETRKSVNAAEKQANASKESADIAQRGVAITQETFRLIERPSLGVDGAELTVFEVGKEIEGLVRFKNSGHTPARHAIVQSRFATQRAGDISTPCPEPPETGMAGLRSRSPIPIEGMKVAHPHTFIVATTEDVQRIESGQWWLYVFVRVDYEGVSGKKYFTEYYARWNPKRKAFEECGIHNDAS